MLALVAAVTALLARTAQARIGGQTGDILGATQQLAEAAALAVLAARV
jgi:adenosylcobinamide-GDP ribazoletransferase